MAAAEGAPPSSDGAQAPPIDYEDVFMRVKDKPCVVDCIDRVYDKGETQLRTRAHIIERELGRVMQATTLEEVHAALDEAGRNLQQLNIFKRIDIVITEDPKDDPEACTVVLDLEEKNWYKLNAGTYVQGHETSCEIGAGLNNVSGRAEHISVNAEFGSEKSSEFSVGYELPRVYDLPITFEAKVQRLLHSYQKSSSYSEQLQGAMVGLKSSNGVHSCQYELGWRKLLDSSRTASRSVLAQTGDYLKSALKYSLLLDKRTTQAGQQRGWAMKSSSEVSGLGPDTSLRLCKQQMDAVASIPILKSVSLNLALSAGILLPWGGDYMSRPTCIADRFFLGGSSTMRGFSHRSVCPTDARRPAAASAGGSPSPSSAASAKRDALGGDLYASVMAALQFQLPHDALRALNIHGHCFVNGGNNAQLSGISRSVQDSARQFGTTFRWSAGAGLVVPTWFGRFEANYVWILSQQATDRCKQGMQLGFAPSVL